MDPNILGSIVGSAIGVLGAFLLFFLGEWFKAKIASRRLRMACLREADYNIELLRDCTKVTQRLKSEIAVGKQQIYFDFDCKNILGQFFGTAYGAGLFYDKLEGKLISDLNGKVLTFFSQDLNTYIANQISDYANGQKTPQEMLETLEWIEVHARDAMAVLQRIKKEL